MPIALVTIVTTLSIPVACVILATTSPNPRDGSLGSQEDFPAFLASHSTHWAAVQVTRFLKQARMEAGRPSLRYLHSGQSISSTSLPRRSFLGSILEA